MLTPAASSVASARLAALAVQGLTLVLLAYVLGPHDFGVFSLVLVVQSLVAVVSNLGILTSGQYHAGRGELDPSRVATASLVATAVGCVVLVPPSGFLLSSVYPIAFPALPLGLFVLGLLAGPIRLGYEAMLGVFIGTGDVRGQTLVAVTGPVLFFVLLGLVVVTTGLTLATAVLAWLASQVAVLAIALFETRRHGGLLAPRDVVSDRRAMSALFQVGLGAYASYLAYWGAMRLDRVALNVAGGTEAVGIFSLAAWVAESFALLPMSVGAVLYPRLALDQQDRIGSYLPAAMRGVLGVSLILAGPAIAAMAALSLTLSGTFAPALLILVLILPGHVLFGLFGVFINYWITRGRTGTAAVYYVVAAGLKAAAVLLLFDLIGLAGVAAVMSVIGAGLAVHAARSIATEIGVPSTALLVPRTADLRRAVDASGQLVARLRVRA